MSKDIYDPLNTVRPSIENSDTHFQQAIPVEATLAIYFVIPGRWCCVLVITFFTFLPFNITSPVLHFNYSSYLNTYSHLFINYYIMLITTIVLPYTVKIM